jgi:hypothetical protein
LAGQADGLNKVENITGKVGRQSQLPGHLIGLLETISIKMIVEATLIRDKLVNQFRLTASAILVYNGVKADETKKHGPLVCSYSFK